MESEIGRESLWEGKTGIENGREGKVKPSEDCFHDVCTWLVTLNSTEFTYELSRRYLSLI